MSIVYNKQQTSSYKRPPRYAKNGARDNAHLNISDHPPSNQQTHHAERITYTPIMQAQLPRNQTSKPTQNQAPKAAQNQTSKPIGFGRDVAVHVNISSGLTRQQTQSKYIQTQIRRQHQDKQIYDPYDAWKKTIKSEIPKQSWFDCRKKLMYVFADDGSEIDIFSDFLYVYLLENNRDKYAKLELRASDPESSFHCIFGDPIDIITRFKNIAPIEDLISRYTIDILYINPPIQYNPQLGIYAYPIMIGNCSLQAFIQASPAKVILIKLPKNYKKTEFIGYQSMSYLAANDSLFVKILCLIK